MHLPLYLIVISMVLVLTDSAPSSKFNQIQFIGNENNRQYVTSTKRQSNRSTRSYEGLDVGIEFLTESSFPFVYPHPSNFIAFNFEENGQVSPDFSNGLGKFATGCG
ncbi:hypothetical protein NQ314_020406 [Rhamnusium bicolor]|uniref:Uncharacterized protein n=1 Tax=Rhamnusium bicolor TaxID=1586634 RepID=A0AAV8WL70_9CUCU|nr:hypothetical protein NQ314_020406 [Rhamnusium bicolor]